MINKLDDKYKVLEIGDYYQDNRQKAIFVIKQKYRLIMYITII